MKTRLKTLIIEDDLNSQEYLSLIILKNIPEIEIIGYAESVIKSIELINNLKPELVFMDVILKDGLSFEIFDKIDHYDFEVIFVSGHDNYIQKAIDHYAFSFVTKPVLAEKIVNIVHRYLKLKNRFFTIGKFHSFSNYLKDDNSMLLIHVSNRYISVEIDEIIKLAADGNYTYFHLKGSKKYLASKSLKYYEGLLKNKRFFRVNRSYLININFIDSIYKKETIILKDGDKINISVRNKTQISSLIKKLS